ncbi:hypothetical protein CHS0354_009710 [Potamilus streckersoni]|uniref:Ig-like domain-containing protein n=1 Tax=Potamilus streckersoni TaxID=2493646 RepID=A0AAE0S0L7_9BIVA|nr:hypothetical protein CHS0354_009710 [Potamilus streckersoni]
MTFLVTVFFIFVLLRHKLNFAYTPVNGGHVRKQRNSSTLMGSNDVNKLDLPAEWPEVSPAEFEGSVVNKGKTLGCKLAESRPGTAFKWDIMSSTQS